MLTDRVLSLRLHGSAPSRLLCLTFTKAAAAEMANRLADRLSEWAVMSEATLSENLEALLGSAAETILHQVDCSVLTVKPDGFVTPVRLTG